MIKIKDERFTITTPNTDATLINWEASTSSSCISINKTSGTLSGRSGEILLSFEFQTEACLNSETITILATDDLGCTQSASFNFDNPCDSFTHTLAYASVTGEPLAFNSGTAGHVGQVYHTWSWDETNFAPTEGSDLKVGVPTIYNTIVLRPISENAPNTIQITVTAEDSVTGCKSTKTLDYGPCTPIAFDVQASPKCLDNELGASVANFGQYFIFGLVNMEASACPGREIINYYSVEIRNNPDPSNFYIVYYAENQLGVYIKNKETSGTFTFQYRVQDLWGVYSQWATVTLTVQSCSVHNTRPEPVIPLLTKTLADDENDPGDVHTWDLLDLIDDPNEEIDWSSFDFIEGLNQTRNSATNLTAYNGTATYANNTVTYTIGTINGGTEALRYNLSTKSGKLLNTGRIFINLDLDPITSPDTDAASYDVAEGGFVEIKISNATKDKVNMDTLTIDTAPTKGTVTVTPEGFIYRATDGEGGADSFIYYTYSPDGRKTPTDTVTINIINSGLGTVTKNYCTENGTVTLRDLITGITGGGSKWTAGGTWTQDASNPDTLTIGSSPTYTSNLTGKATGTYKLTYTVTAGTATSSSTLTLRYRNNFKQVTVGTAMNFTSGYTHNVAFLLANIDVSQVVIERWKKVGAPLTCPVDANGGSLDKILTSADYVWNGTTIDITFTQNAGEIYEYILKYTDSCGVEQSVYSGCAVS
jgi:hypothetical protein